MTKRPVVHVEFPVADREAAEKFYGELFGWKFSHYPAQQYSVFETGRVSGAFNLTGDALSEPGSPLIFVASDNIDADLERIEAHGGETFIPRTPIPGVGWYAIFIDPAGNQIGLLTVSS